MSTHARSFDALRMPSALREALAAYLELDGRLGAPGGVAGRAPTPCTGTVEEVAAAVRRSQGLGTAPVKDLFELAYAALGIDVFSVELSDVDTTQVARAGSVRDVATGRSAVAVTTTHRPGTQRFAVAQELGRLLLGELDGPVDGGAAQAEAFARHLLLPVESVVERCVKGDVVDLRQLSDLVQAFEVPPEVAALQLRTAGLVDAETFAAWSGLSAVHLATRFGWRSQYEQLVVEASTARAPQGLVWRAVEAYLVGTLGLDELAHWAGQDPADLQCELGAVPAGTPAPSPVPAPNSGPDSGSDTAPEAVPARPASTPPVPPAVLTSPHLGRYVPTPACTQLAAHLAADDLVAAASVLDEHWLEIWYAVDPTDLRTLLAQLPDELLDGMDSAHYLRRISGDAHDGRSPRGRRREGFAGVEEVAQVVADLRLAGRPAAALVHVESLAKEARSMRGRIVGSSGGRVELWLVQGAITALLAGDLAAARGALMEATRVHRPDRFPFVRREAAAKLALAQVLLSGPAEAQEWIAQARQEPVTGSWVEALVDDTLWLAEYLCALDTLDLELAERMRLSRPSPLDHLEFWGIALQAHVRHLLLTGRRQQARALCDSVAGMGLPLPGSDGWLATMLDDARLMTQGVGLATAAKEATGSHAAPSPLRVLSHRVALLSAGLFEAGTQRHPYEADDSRDPRVRLALRLLRAQSMVGVGRVVEGRPLLDTTLAEVVRSGLHSVLRHLTPETLECLATTAEGAAVVDLVRRHDLAVVTVEPLLSAPLTAAEGRVLELLAAGFSRQMIADTLVVSLSTVKSHLRTAYQKLGVGDRDEAVAKWERLGLGV